MTEQTIETEQDIDTLEVAEIELEEITLREERAGWCLCSYNAS